MNNFSVVSDINGVAKILLSKYMKNPEDLSGHTFYIRNHLLTIGDGNVVTIPAKIMREIAEQRSDGRYAMGIQLSFRHVNKKKVVGGGVINTPHIKDYLEDIPDGKPLPKAAALDDPTESEVLVPADIKEFTQSEVYE